VIEVDGVLDDVDLVFERRVDVDGGISEKEWPGVSCRDFMMITAHRNVGAAFFFAAALACWRRSL